MKKFRYEIIIFTVNAVCMILELVASRILSPYFGNSNIVWTSVIGIILLSSSIGNYFGGKIADNETVHSDLKLILLLSAVFIILIPFIDNEAIEIVVLLTSNLKLGAIISTIILFLIPSVILGLLTPIILKLKLENLDSAGKSSGKVVSIATLGGIFGTFLGGFFLIPHFGCANILLILGIVLLLLEFVTEEKMNIKYTISIIVVIILVLLIFIYRFNNNNDLGRRILDGEIGIDYSLDTEYGRVLIYNSKTINDENIRTLKVDRGHESATFTDKDKQNELVYEYTKYYDLMFESKENIKDILLIGGAGYSYPKYIISHYDDKNMDVVEIDGKILEIAKKYFYLDDLIKEYNINENNRLKFITEDGRTYLNNNEKKYDAILNDAFTGTNPAKTLTTIENIEHIKHSLNENGVYLSNIVSALDGKDSKFIKAEVNTLKQVFKNVYVVPCNYKDNMNSVQNNMVVATDDDTYKPKDYVELNIDDNEIILTDDYCPVDTLIPEI